MKAEGKLGERRAYWGMRKRDQGVKSGDRKE